jgi:DNA invertase Pin-like site-specific DNA recombinase
MQKGQGIMKVLYVRISTVNGNQKSDRQLINSDNYDLVVKDNGISGTTDFFDRDGGRKIKELIHDDVSFDLYIADLDRIGRNIGLILTNIQYLSSHGINLIVINQGIQTLLPDGKPNPTAKLMISILASVSEMELSLQKSRVREGIQAKKLNDPSAYSGRKKGTKESVEKYLSKPKTKEIIRILNKGNTVRDTAKIAEVSVASVMKTKKILESI